MRFITKRPFYRMNTIQLGSAAVAVAYASAAWRSWPLRAGRKPIALAVEQLVLGILLLAHAGLLGVAIFAPAGVNLGLTNALSLIFWLTLAIYWFTSFFYHVDGLPALALPFAAAAVALAAVFPGQHTVEGIELSVSRLHILIAMLAYGLLTIAALHAVLMAWAERRLHLHPSHTRWQLPPLLTMEAILFRVLWSGFILLTMTLASGMMFSEELFGKPFRINHKTIFGLISWAIYAGLLTGRVLYGWRGRQAARWALWGFAMLVLAYMGSKFVLEVVLHRT